MPIKNMLQSNRRRFIQAVGAATISGAIANIAAAEGINDISRSHNPPDLAATQFENISISGNRLRIDRLKTTRVTLKNIAFKVEDGSFERIRVGYLRTQTIFGEASLRNVRIEDPTISGLGTISIYRNQLHIEKLRLNDHLMLRDIALTIKNGTIERVQVGELLSSNQFEEDLMTASEQLADGEQPELLDQTETPLLIESTLNDALKGNSEDLQELPTSIEETFDSSNPIQESGSGSSALGVFASVSDQPALSFEEFADGGGAGGAGGGVDTGGSNTGGQGGNTTDYDFTLNDDQVSVLLGAAAGLAAVACVACYTTAVLASLAFAYAWRAASD